MQLAEARREALADGLANLRGRAHLTDVHEERAEEQDTDVLGAALRGGVGATGVRQVADGQRGVTGGHRGECRVGRARRKPG